MARQPTSDAVGRCLHIGDSARSVCAATVFACGAGDGNRTRTVSLGMETLPASAHDGQGQGCPYLTVSARQRSFVDR